jgi:hypothetical protein
MFVYEKQAISHIDLSVGLGDVFWPHGAKSRRFINNPPDIPVRYLRAFTDASPFGSQVGGLHNPRYPAAEWAS